MPVPIHMESATYVHLLDCVAQSVSEDKATAMLVFDVDGAEGPRKFAVTLPVDKVQWLVSVVYEMLNKVKLVTKDQSTTLFHFPIDFGAATSPELDERSFPMAENSMMPVGPKVVIGFDMKKPSELNFVLLRDDALKFADMIVKTCEGERK
jgi:hypothetical protein